MRKELLIIFYRNPKLGKVKTRLAVALGEEKALAVYLTLVAHTRKITLPLTMDKVVYYSEFIDREDNWDNQLYIKKRQEGATLGDRMYHAFEEAFRNGFTSVCIIGTDCFELTPGIINEGFLKLKSTDAVIGPAKDGGYYLLGMNKLYREVFRNKAWGTNTVLHNTINDFNKIKVNYTTLPTLRDVDEAGDLPNEFKFSGDD